MNHTVRSNKKYKLLLFTRVEICNDYRRYTVKSWESLIKISTSKFKLN